MRKIFTKYLLLLILLVGCYTINGQTPISLYYLETIPQSNFANAAMAPRCNTFVGLPSVYFNLDQNMPINTLLQQTDSGTVSILSHMYDFGKLEKKLGGGFNIINHLAVSPIAFGFRMKTGYFTFATTLKTDIKGRISSDLFKIPQNEFFPLNTSYDLGGTGLDFQTYMEYAFGYSRNITKKLRVGGRFKLLQGLASVKSDIKKVKITTPEALTFPENAWEFDVEGDIYTSAPIVVESNDEGIIETIEPIPAIEDGDMSTLINDYGLTIKNLGFAADLGVTYRLNYSWNFSAGVNDLGFIRWKNDLNSIHFKGVYEFGGLDLNGQNIDSIEVVVEELMDSIKTVVDYHSENKAFSTKPTTMFHVGAQYHVNHTFSAGFLSRTMVNTDYFHQEFSLSANLNLYQGLTTNLNYNVALNGEQYAGFGLGLRLFPIQFYLMLDHIPIVYTKYNIYEDSEDTDPQTIPGPYDVRSFNVMVGLNLIFGQHGYKDSPKIDAYSEF